MNYWKESLKIGNLIVPRFIGGPLDGVTDSPFRKLVRMFSKDNLLYTELRHTACVANDKGVTKCLRFDQSERPLNFQLTTNSLEFVEEACQRVQKEGVDAIDLNIGCPAKNIVKSGSGSAMMAEPELLEQVLKLMRKSINIPFTVKMRAGFKHKNVLEIAKMVEACGADALAIHPRLQTQKHSGELDFEVVAQVKKTVKIPVLFSGNIIDFESAKKTYENTGVDGYLIGRALWAKPWILKELEANAEGKEFVISEHEILAIALKHLDFDLEFYGDQGLYHFRKYLPYYVKEKSGASEVRKKLIVSESVEEVKKELTKFLG
ncbi:MAG: tRNA-dihydrouridine synthase [candidate division TM6 bacterium GW2011_GWF2_32_72]|nr:MAG: tRNA-dihydrouridine synthase [candidate division TM6 bacterium GW2011_GWF2_32_72]